MGIAARALPKAQKLCVVHHGSGTSFSRGSLWSTLDYLKRPLALLADWAFTRHAHRIPVNTSIGIHENAAFGFIPRIRNRFDSMLLAVQVGRLNVLIISAVAYSAFDCTFWKGPENIAPTLRHPKVRFHAFWSTRHVALLSTCSAYSIVYTLWALKNPS